MSAEAERGNVDAPLTFSALIPAPGGLEGPWGLRFQGRPLLERTIAKVRGVRGILRVLVPGEDGVGPGASAREMGAEPVAPSEPGSTPGQGGHGPGRHVSALLSGLREDLRAAVTRGGLVVVDPRYPFLDPREIGRALEAFAQGRSGPRPWPSVYSFHETPSHFHPRKLLVLEEGGGLTHFQPGGEQVYQRQQLEGDPYYCLNDALLVVDPLGEVPEAPEGTTLGLVLADPVVRIDDARGLTLAEDVCGRDPQRVEGRI